MNLISVVASNSFYQFLSRLVSALSVLAVTFLITRNLSRDVWGDFVIVTSYIGLFAIISDFGLNAIFVREISQKQEQLGEFFHNLLGLRLILSLFSIFGALAVLAFLPHSFAVKTAIIVGSALVLLQSTFISTSAVFQHKLRYDFFALSDILGSLTIILLVFLASLASANLLTIVFIFLIGNCVKTVIGLFFARKIVGSLRLRFNFNLWRLLFFSSIPLGLMLVMSQFNANIDKQIIALVDPKKLGVSSAVAVGIYGLSYRIFDFVIAISTFFANSLYPILLQKLENSREGFESLAKKSVATMFLLGLGVGVVGWLLSPLVLSIFGEYSESLVSLRILILSTPIFFVSALLLWINITLGKEKILPFIYAFALLCNLALNLALIPRLGYNFAAWSTVITEVVILLLLSGLLVYNTNVPQENNQH